MTTLIVLFNLKPGVSIAAYEAWTKSTDLPVVRSLASVSSFQVFRNTGLLGSDASPPYAYTEIIHVPDMEVLGKDLAAEKMQKVAAEFQSFADNPTFMLSHNIESD
jgi:hypothetical protein